MKLKTIILFTIFCFLFICSCDITDSDNGLEPQDINAIIVEDDFNYKTSKEIEVDLEVLTDQGEPLDSILLSLYNNPPQQDGNLIGRGNTIEGNLLTKLKVPTYKESLTIVGFMNTITLPIINNKVYYQYGGVVPLLPVERFFYPTKIDDYDYSLTGGYDNFGVPQDHTHINIPGWLIVHINNILPEQIPLPQYHPEYFGDDIETNIVVDDTTQIKVTFIHEVADYQNAIGFVLWETDNGIPNSPDQLTHYILFPNTSKPGSGGQLLGGDRMTFNVSAGVTVSIFLVQNGWNGSEVSTNAPIFYSESSFNPESNPDKRQHVVLLNDLCCDNLILGFEDQNREGGFDEDFNDVVFSVKAIPMSGIDTTDIVPADIIDSDEDGVPDDEDDYPDDEERAFNNYFPDEDTDGTLAFEDNWPSKGDYDFNDIIMDYNINQVTNAQNELVDIVAQFRLEATGAGYNNGFAVQLPIVADNVNSFNALGNNTIYIDNNTDNACVILFDHAFDLLVEPADPTTWVNTVESEPYVDPVTLEFSLTLSNTIPVQDLEYLPPYNPFIFVNSRDKEIHLPDYAPTSVADLSYFGTLDDDSNIAEGRYYKTENNLPWAIDITEEWQYPIELKQITHAYLEFTPWAESGGTTNQNWYKVDQASVNMDLIYIPPDKK